MSSSTEDPLHALKRAIKSGASITYANADGPCPSLAQATHLVLSPTLSLPKSTPTRFRKPGISTASSPSDFYSLEAIHLAWLLRGAAGADYMKQARENGLAVGFVSITERKSVVDWLEGRIAEHERLAPPTFAESTTPPGTPPSMASRLPAYTPSKTAHLSSSASTTSPQKRRYVPDTHDIEIVKKIRQNEVELQDRNTVLRGFKPNNFSAIKNVYADKLKKLKEAGKAGATPAQPTTPAQDGKLQHRRTRHMYPIIMISSSPTALITMHNVKRFLQESTFEPSQEARVRAATEGNPRPEDMIPIYRKLTSIDSSGKEVETQARYFVVDSVEALAKFGADAWDRVVCVMTTGQAWQFRPYKWNEPIQLFHHVKGIYVSWSNDPPNHKIKDWNVTELKIDPHRRHVDKSVVAHFWKTLDMWILANKPWLIKN